MKERILFVDDDPKVGKVFCKMAQRMGYQLDYDQLGSALSRASELVAEQNTRECGPSTLSGPVGETGRWLSVRELRSAGHQGGDRVGSRS